MLYQDKPTERLVFKQEGDTWKLINFIDIKTGNVIQLKEPDGSIVTHENGTESFIAKSDAKLDELGLLYFEI